MIRDWLKRIRIEKGLTLVELATRSGLTHGHLSRLETGRSQLTLLTAVRIMDVLDLSWTTLFTEGFIKKDLPIPDLYRSQDVEFFSFPCLNFNDIDPFAESQLLSTGKTSLIVIELLKIFIKNCKPNLEPTKVEMLATSAYPFLDSSDGDVFDFSEEVSDIQLHYPENFAPEKLRKIYLAGGILILADLGTYIRHLREIKGLSLRQLGSLVQLSHPALRDLETKMSDKIKLNDLIQLDNALELDGELIVFAWRTAELYLGVHRIPSQRKKTIMPWQSHEIQPIERLIITSRLFQNYFPENSEWLNWFRRQSLNGFNETL